MDTRANLPFYGMIAGTKSYDFTMIFLAVFPLEPTFWPAQCFSYMIFKTEIVHLKATVSSENIAGNISCEVNTEMMSLFRLDTIRL